MWRPRSLRVRFTLRALLVFITLFMLWGGYHTNRSWNERVAERVLLRHRAMFSYAPRDLPRSAIDHLARTYERLVGFVWGDRRITSLSVNSRLESDVVAAICSLPQLESLDISGVNPNDPFDLHSKLPSTEHPAAVPRGALAKILAARTLTTLSIDRCNLHVSDYLAIASHESIEVLTVTDTNLSDFDLAILVRLPRLRQLTFVGAEVTGEDLASQPGSLSLERINCANSPVGIEFAQYVSNCPHLTHLQVSHVRIDDAFVAQLRGHSSLSQLLMSNTSISDTSIDYLIDIPQLEVVYMRPSRVTAAGIKRLRQTRPGIKTN